MDGELYDYRQEDVEVEYISKRSFTRQFVHRLYEREQPSNLVERVRTLARDIHKKHTEINIPDIVIW